MPARSLRKPFPPPGPRLSPRKRKEERIELVQAFKILALRAPSPPPLQPRPRIDHFVMNLPESAIDFLDAFRGFLSPENIGIDAMEIYDVMPMIHCYCFTRELESDKAEVDIRKVRFFFLGAAAFHGVDVWFQRVEEQLGHPLVDEVALHMVRSVAPGKDMYCISFRLPRIVAFDGVREMPPVGDRTRPPHMDL